MRKKESDRVGGAGGGSRRKFETPEILRDKIKDYFAYCEEGEIPMTVVGLAAFLDITRKHLSTYQNGEHDFKSDTLNEDGEDFSEIVEKAKEYIENDKLVNALQGKYAPAIAIFDLKNNHNYTDKQDLNLGLGAERPIIVDDIPKIAHAAGTAIINSTIIEVDLEEDE